MSPWEPGPRLFGNLYIIILGTLTTFTWKTWDPCREPWGNLLGTFWEPFGNLEGTLRNLGNLGNLERTLGTLGTLGTFTWEPGNLYLGTFTWEPLLGNLGTFTWEPLLGNLYLEPGNLGGTGFGAAPVCSETFTMAEDPKAFCCWGKNSLITIDQSSLDQCRISRTLLCWPAVYKAIFQLQPHNPNSRGVIQYVYVMYINMYICNVWCTCIYICIYIYIHIYMYIYIYVYIYMYIYIYTYMYIHIYIYIHKYYWSHCYLMCFSISCCSQVLKFSRHFQTEKPFKKQVEPQPSTSWHFIAGLCP